jgi:transcriptional regulator with XRE-family HTH domain
MPFVPYNVCAMRGGELLKDARRQAGLTQAALAKRAGTSQAVIARMESRASNPTFASVDRVLRATGHELALTRRQPKENVDETLIAANLRLTPAERLRRFMSWHESLRQMTEAAERSRGTVS